MELVSLKTIPMSEFKSDATGNIYLIIIDISDLEQRVEDMHKVVTDTSWLSALNIVEQMTYKARSRPTIEKIVNEILNKVDSDISVDFGEYMVSDTAQSSLEKYLNHVRLPLAELIKEKISGNPGFDFHTESHANFVAFGEAKFSGVQNSHGRALSQINKFIVAEKDIQELSDIQHFVSKAAIQSAVNGSKSFTAAFSITSDDTEKIMDNALNSQLMLPLLAHKEVYLIGVKVSA
ncbi:hypothetical protein [Shewanella chilikensis]|uniref:hypothetical protein n=1 Tax=Shewanella chilikensis TaxID=558541 RepID=UPI0008F95B94|nr:hypothetical protein BFS86_14240 [Shewanella algae]